VSARTGIAGTLPKVGGRDGRRYFPLDRFPHYLAPGGNLKNLIRVILLALLGVGALATPATATPTPKLANTLGRLWTAVLETPAPQNPFGSGDAASACWRLGGTVTPFGPAGVPSCTVKPGTKIFEVGNSVECSTFEGNGTTEAQLRACARSSDVKTAPTVTVDGRPIPVVAAETDLLHITLPANNIFGVPASCTGLSVGHGWVALLHPLTPGSHTIVIKVPGSPTITTTIVVQPQAHNGTHR
jgi:hypothetical protein